jgi:hypothetical protein
MFPDGGYSETMSNDQVDEPFWCDRCGTEHFVSCEEEK